MAVEYRFDEVQTKPHAVLVHAAGAVGLVEAVKDVRQIVRRDGLAPILHGDERLAVLFIYSDAYGAALLRKFNCVVGQIVDDLRYRVGVRKDHDGIFGELRIDVEVLFRGSALKAQKRL